MRASKWLRGGPLPEMNVNALTVYIGLSGPLEASRIVRNVLEHSRPFQACRALPAVFLDPEAEDSGSDFFGFLSSSLGTEVLLIGVFLGGQWG